MKRFALLTGAGLGLVLLLTACATSRAGYESAAYTVLKTDGAFEVREYPKLTVVTTTMDPERKERDDRFMRLFRYIDGNNAASQKVAMTTPVFMTGEESAAGTAKMAFVVPAAVATAGAPTPQADDVVLESMPARRVVAVRFSGVTNPTTEAKKLAELRAWIESQGMTSEGEPFRAFYDPPWTPGPLRRNEVLLPVSVVPEKE